MNFLEFFISIFNYLDTHNWIVPCILSIAAILQSAVSYKLARNVFELEVSRMVSDSLNDLSKAKEDGMVFEHGTDNLSALNRNKYEEALIECLDVLNQICLFREEKKISKKFFEDIVMFRIRDVLLTNNSYLRLDQYKHKYLYNVYQEHFQNHHNKR